jgi:retron-type reverse transcriptase
VGCGTGHHVAGSFDNIDHGVLLSILREQIHDGRFTRLLSELLKAGYLEDWSFRPTRSGTPQGGIVTPKTILQKSRSCSI